MNDGLTAVVVTYNSSAHIEACLLSLLAAPAHVLARVLIVDNNSADETVAKVSSLRDGRVTLHKNSQNLGFAGAVNLVLPRASGHVLLLNPDTIIPEGALERCVEHISNNLGTGIVAPRLVDLSGALQPSLVHFPTLRQALGSTLLFRRWMTVTPEQYPSEAYERSGEVEAAMGAFLVLRSEVVRELGLLATWTFMYGEDLDYCFRARARGWRLMYLPGVEITHIGGGSSRDVWTEQQRLRRTFAARQRFLRVHHGWLYAFTFKAVLLGDLVLRLFVRVPRRNWSGSQESWRMLKATL